MTGPLSQNEAEEVMHALRALLETEREIEENGRDTSVSADEVDSMARRLAARFGRPTARSTDQEPMAFDDIDLAWLELSESMSLSFRGSATQEVSASPAPSPIVLEVTDPAIGATVVVSGSPAEGRWTVRVIGAPLGRYAVELTWGDETEVSTGEVQIVSARPASVVLFGPHSVPLRLRLRPINN